MNARALIPEWFLQTKLGREMVAEDSKERDAQRTKQAETRARAIAELAAALPKLSAALEAAKAVEDKTRLALRDAEAARVHAWNELASAGIHRDLVCQLAEKELRKTADPQIDVFINELYETAERDRRVTPLSESRGGKDFLGRLMGPVFSTRPSLVARHKEILAGIAAAEALKLEVAPDVAARLAEIRGTISGGTEMVQVA